MSQYPQHLLAHDFLQRAEEFFQAFRDLPARTPPSWPRYFLLCHSIELALKAYLASRGCATSDLKRSPFGHDLSSLLAYAVNAGLALGPLAARGEIERLNEAHTNFWPRYPKEDAKPVFLIDSFEPYVVELLRAIATSLRGSNYRLYVDY